MSDIIPRKDGLVVVRELRGPDTYWLHVYGPNTLKTLTRGRSMADAEARKWARELGKSAGGWISAGASWNGTKGGGNWARTSTCYVFRSTDK